MSGHLAQLLPTVSIPQKRSSFVNIPTVKVLKSPVPVSAHRRAVGRPLRPPAAKLPLLGVNRASISTDHINEPEHTSDVKETLAIKKYSTHDNYEFEPRGACEIPCVG